MSKDKIESFIKWLDEQESRKDWTDYRLAKEANISFSVLSKARNNGVLPKWDACVAIANALKVSPITVFRVVGLLPPGSEDKVKYEDLEDMLEKLPAEDVEEIKSIAEMKLKRKDNEKSLKSLKSRKT
jgi:transcriptional regulator with XRE-family HTH domain